MRALVYTATEKVALEERPRPIPRNGEVEVAIDLAGVCGSDISGFLGHSSRRLPPLVLGHELVGRLPDGRRVVANPLVSCGRCHACMSGAQNLCASWWLLGMDRVPGTFAEYVTLPAAQVHEIPQSLPASRAIMVEPLANIVHLFRLAAPPPFFRLAIVGAGVMGSLCLKMGLSLGARDILVADLNHQRLEIMRQLGAAHALNTGSPEGMKECKTVAGSGFDVVIDASGSGPARQAAFDLCRPGGQIVLLGMGEQSSAIDFVTSMRKEHRVVMSFAYTPLDFERSLSLILEGAVDLAPWTAQLPLEEGQQALDLISHTPGSTLKMTLAVTNAN
jgi:threonine dehydrogenase-like Zn-dependent dehydrogenase